MKADTGSKKILILGANGFIGTHLTEKILAGTDWRVEAFDCAETNVSEYRRQDRYSFTKGDLFTDDAWLKGAVAASDAVLPLAGIAKPAYYMEKPLWTFELDFEQNLKVVRMCVEAGKRVIFPSTSEVYGMSEDSELIEDESPLTVGPVTKSRWIYSCGKQMMDRLIIAYGTERGLDYTLFRPFNWVGPRLDTFEDAKERKARSITQMVYDVLNRGEISLVGGGENRRSFLWVDDATDALLAILKNERGRASRQIFNIGNPANNASIRELAQTVVRVMGEFPPFAEAAGKAALKDVKPETYYKEGYQDTRNRVPSVRKIKDALGWEPKTGFEELVRRTVAYFARKSGAEAETREEGSA